MCGLPGSGKSSYAKDIDVATPYITKPVIHSSDKLREEMFGNEAAQGDNNKLFCELHRRIKNDLMNCRDVIYDATNIKKKERIQFLESLNKINCFPICVVMATEYEACLFNNKRRERVVPDYVIERMWHNWTPPHYGEGFEHIDYIFSYLSDNNEITHESMAKYTLGKFFEKADGFNQENKHHTLSLGEHSTKAATYIQEHAPDNFNLLYAAMLHDNGKLFTKTEINAKGEQDGDCHYYQHHCVGAYNSMFYLHRAELIKGENIAEITNLIYYHMHPYIQWKQSERVLNRDKELLGNHLYNDILILHDADLYAH